VLEWLNNYSDQHFERPSRPGLHGLLDRTRLQHHVTEVWIMSVSSNDNTQHVSCHLTLGIQRASQSLMCTGKRFRRQPDGRRRGWQSKTESRTAVAIPKPRVDLPNPPWKVQQWAEGCWTWYYGGTPAFKITMQSNYHTVVVVELIVANWINTIILQNLVSIWRQWCLRRLLPFGL
jgi:hypothetical protein